MSHVRVAFVVLAIAVAPRFARGDSLHESSVPEPSSPRIEPCPEDDGVVGIRRCPDFGVWGAALEEPYLIASFGLTIRRIPHGDARAPVAERSTTPQPPAGDDLTTSYAIVQQFTLSVSRHLFVAHELEISPTLDDSPEPDDHRMAVGTQLVAGIHAGTRWITLRAEIAGGIRVMQNQDDEGVLEARLRGDLWISPWVTFGAAAGTSVLDRREKMLALYIGMHTWSFGGW